MTDLLKQIEMVKNFGQAMQNGIERSAQMLPTLTKQQIDAKARKKLHTTYNDYMESINTSFKDYVFIVEMDADNWIANAVETGVQPFSMKPGLLNSPKAKVSKSGFRYMHVPIGKEKGRDPESFRTQKQKDYQEAINFVLQKPKFGATKLSIRPDGSVIESQKLLNSSSLVSGFYRFRKYESPEQYYATNKRGLPFGHVMFRTISEKGSKTGAQWDHPGIEPVRIFKEVERELPEIFEKLLESNIQAELKDLF